MIFENLWPLLFLAAIPFIILLYLLKPRGKDTVVSSNLLWKKIILNEQSQTFFEKFIHNLLMYLQIGILLLLIVSFMSPFILKNAAKTGRQIIVLDTSASMQIKTDAGKTRFEEAIDKLTSYIHSKDGISLTIITSDSSGNNILAIDNTDKDSCINLLKNLSPSDCSDNIADTHDLVLQLAQSNDTDDASLIICTDANNASSIEAFPEIPTKDVWVVGNPVNNISNNYLVYSVNDKGTMDVIVNVTNYAPCQASFEITLSENTGKILAVNRVSLEANESASSLFKDVDWTSDTCTATLGGFQFADERTDSFDKDNISYGIRDKSRDTSALLLGKGNTFLEKGYQAITNNILTKADTPDANSTYGFYIYDTDYINIAHNKNALIFGGSDYIKETLENVVLSVNNCDLTYGLQDFTMGVNSTKSYNLPEWGHSFLEQDGKCVGFYGEHDGIKEVVIGFDLRETDLVLRPEFPIFLANAINYLTDSSLLAANQYYAGEMLLVEPWAEIDYATLPSCLDTVGLYKVASDKEEEYYFVKLHTDSESNGALFAESIQTISENSFQKAKRTLKNIFLVLAILLLIVEWIVYVKRRRYKGVFYKVMRACIMLLLILSLFQVKLPVLNNMTSTIFLVDMSNSNVDHNQQMFSYLDNEISNMPSHNQYGIICFGKNTSVEQFLTKDKTYNGILSTPEKSATNFEAALSRALSVLPEETKNRIVLLTDGKQTMGEIQNLSPLISSQNVELLSVLYESEEKQDAYIENVEIPTYLHPEEKYSINVLVESNYDTDADLNFYYGSKKSATHQVHLNRGTNRFTFEQQVSDDTMEMLRVVVDAKDDSCEENNAYNVYAIVEDNPKILLVTNPGLDTTAFLPILNNISVEYDVVSSINAPSDMTQMLKYKSIIMANVYIDDLPESFVSNIESYVKDYGGGFVCCGGDNSFALGGYRGTPIETILPVNMQIRNINENPSMAMVMVIDRSGSMSTSDSKNANKLDLAIKAATVAVDNLSDKDMVGVLTFDDGFEWQVPITGATDRDEINEKITQIKDGGGTTIKPALKEAFDQISKANTTVKHVVLLSDGQGETNDFDDIISLYQNSTVTLSTVAVGEDSDQDLLEKLAEECRGRYYFTKFSSDLPKIFAQEVFLGSDSYIQEKEVSLNIEKGHEITKDLFVNGWPNIYGYIASSPKMASRMLLSSEDKDNPILTIWQYGLGHTVAWNSDITGEWTGGFSGKDDYAHLWKRIIDYSIGNTDLGNDNVNVKTVNNHSVINYYAKDYTEETEIIATVIDPNGENSEITLHATAPGTYEADITTDTTGLYHFNIRREDNDKITNNSTTACAVQFSNEYKYNITNLAFVDFMEKHGKIITEDDTIWNNIKQNKQDKFPISNILLALGIVLFLADVAFRRLEITPGKRRTNRNKKDKAEKNKAENKNTGKNDTNINSTDISSINKNSMNKNSINKNSIDKNSIDKNNETASNTSSSEKQNAEMPKKPVKEKKDKKKQENTTLDTSALLKKKQDRNLK